MDEPDTAADRAVSSVVRAAATRYDAPAALRERIAASLAAAAGTERRPTTAHASGSTNRRTGWRTFGIAAAAFAAGVVATWIAVTVLHDPGEIAARQANDVVAAHARAVMLARAIDVESSDRHTVKPWLSSRLDFSPVVVDLAADGFPLAGARLDYVGGRTVAAIVFRRNRHWIDVFVWPAGGSDDTRATFARNGFNTVAWQQDGLRYRAVSDVNAGELSTFAALLQARSVER